MKVAGGKKLYQSNLNIDRDCPDHNKEKMCAYIEAASSTVLANYFFAAANDSKDGFAFVWELALQGDGPRGPLAADPKSRRSGPVR